MKEMIARPNLIMEKQPPIQSHALPLAFDLRLAFYFFIATIPAEMFDVVNKLSIPKLLGVIFVIIIAVRGKWFLRMPLPPFYYFLVYYAFVAISIQWINPFFFGYWKTRMLQLTQLMLFFWVCSFLVSYKQLLRGALTAYSYSVVVLITLANLRVPGFVRQEALDLYKERATVGGADPNTFTAMIGVALIIFIERLFSHFKGRGKWNFRYLFLSLYLVINIIEAGSRGGQVAILAGLVTLFLVGDYKIKKSLFFSLVAILIVIALWYSNYTTTSSDRWKLTLLEGSMSGREKVYPEAMKMIARKPMLGYGLGEHLYVLGPATGKERRDPHSSFIWVLHEVGFIGGTPFILGFLLCGYLAFKNRNGPLGSFPFVLFIITFLVNNDISDLYGKTTWFVLAIAASTKIKHH